MPDTYILKCTCTNAHAINTLWLLIEIEKILGFFNPCSFQNNQIHSIFKRIHKANL